MKKGTIIALVISLIYCGLSAYALITTIINGSSESLFWTSSIFAPGYALGFILGYGGGTPFVILGQIITFFLLFYILKTILNSLFKKSK